MTRDRDDRRGGRTSAKGWSQRQETGSLRRLKLPSNLELFKVDSDKPRRLDFLCWKAGKGNPNAEPGERHFELTYWVHRIGPDSEKFVCPNRTRGLPCPVCEDRARLRMQPDADDDLLKSLMPSQRQLFLVHDLDQMDRGLQLVDYSYYHFGKQIKAEMDASAIDEPDTEYFADLETGFTVRVAFTEEKPYGYKASSVKFVKRAKQYKYALADELPCIEDLLVVEPYEKLKAAYQQTGEAEEEEEPEPDEKPRRDDPERPAGSKVGRPKDEEPEEEPEKEPEEKPEAMNADEAGIEAGDRVRHRRAGVCTVLKVSSDGTSLTLEDADGERVRAVGMDEVRKVEVEAPKKESERRPAKAKATAAGSDDDWEEPADKSPPKRSSEPKRAPEKKEKAPPDDDWDN